MKVKYVSILAILLVLLSGIPLISGSATNYASAKYANTQTQANVNECENGTNCAINSPQSQGDGTASSPTNLQISKFNEDQWRRTDRSRFSHHPDRTRQGNNWGQMSTRFCVSCSKWLCNASECQGPPGNIIIIDPRLFNGEVDGRDVRFVFMTSPALYLISQTVPPTPQGLTLTTTDSPECVGDLQNGVTRNYLFINEYRVATPSP